MHPDIHSCNVHNSQTVDEAKMPFNRQMDKDVVHIYNGLLVSHQKEQLPNICSNMDGTERDNAK